MDKRLTIKGSSLIDIYVDLDANTLNEFALQYYPVAYSKEFDGMREYFKVFPHESKVASLPEDITTKHISAYIDSDLGFTLSFSSHSGKFSELYYSIQAANEYLTHKGYHIKPGQEEFWGKLVHEAAKAKASVVSKRRHTIFTENSSEYKKWSAARLHESLSDEERIRLMILLRSYTGVTNRALEFDYGKTNMPREKNAAIDIVVPKLRKLFPGLPVLPCEGTHAKDIPSGDDV